MTKGLEALEKLMKKYYELCLDARNNDDEYQKYNLTSERAIIEKRLKALEIINKKNVDIWWLKTSVDFIDYNLQRSNKSEQLTEKQYNLLKEVLEND